MSHVDPDDNSFRRSLLRAAAGGLLALVVTFGVTGLLMRLGRDDGTGGPAVVLTDSPAVSPTVTPLAESPTPSPEPSPTALATTEAAVPTETSERPVSGITVQVLEQVGAEVQAAEAAQVLRELGYDVVAVNVTDRQVDTTTVLASAGHLPDAEQLQRLDARFATVTGNDGFSADVNLHVIVAADFSD